MSRKRKTYSVDFKAKLVLELLEGDKTLNEVASKYEAQEEYPVLKKEIIMNDFLLY